MINPRRHGYWGGYSLTYKGKVLGTFRRGVGIDIDPEGRKRLSLYVEDVPGDNTLFAVRADELRHLNAGKWATNLFHRRKELVWAPTEESRAVMRGNAGKPDCLRV